MMDADELVREVDCGGQTTRGHMRSAAGSYCGPFGIRNLGLRSGPTVPGASQPWRPLREETPLTRVRLRSACSPYPQMRMSSAEFDLTVEDIVAFARHLTLPAQRRECVFAG